METGVAGVNHVEMINPRKISPQDLDRLYAHGSASEDLEDISRLVQNVRSKYLGQLDPDLETAHLAALMQVVNFTDKGDLAARPANKTDGPGFLASGMPKRRGRFVLQSMFATLSTKLALGGAAVAMAATGGLAGTGHLPDRAQTAVAHAAERVGIVIPLGETAQSAAGGVNAIAEQAVESALKNAEAAVRAAEQKAAVGDDAKSPNENSEFGQNTAADANSGAGRGVSDAARAEAEERRTAGQANRPEDAGPPEAAGPPQNLGPPAGFAPVPEAGRPGNHPSQNAPGIAGETEGGGSIPAPVPGGGPPGVGGGRP
jgi:hypothetical protein